MITDENVIKKIISSKEMFVFDMDGTIYLGENVFPFARDFILRLREHGKRVLFFTNNASRTAEFYINRLTRMGFEPRNDEVMTAGDVTAEYLLRECKNKSVYVVGTPLLISSFRKMGINLVCDDDSVPYSKEKVPDIVVTSFDTTLTYEKLKYACHYIRNGSRYLSTHSDFNCPTENGFIPDSGAISALVTASTGVTPEYFGKPEKICADMICATSPFTKDKIVMFGDRLYTDIAAGRRSGITSVLVYTGETTRDMVENEMKENPEGERIPDISVNSLGDIDRIMFL